MRRILNPVIHNLNDTKLVEKFLLFPKSLPRSDGVVETRWLEWVRYETRVCTVCKLGNSQKLHYGWVDTRWVDYRGSEKKALGWKDACRLDYKG